MHHHLVRAAPDARAGTESARRCKEGSSSKILHFRLWKLSTGRFSLEKAPAAKDPVFPSLQEFVTAHPNHFKVPVEKAASGYGAFDE